MEEEDVTVLCEEARVIILPFEGIDPISIIRKLDNGIGRQER